MERIYDYHKILQGILDVGEAMLISGAEVNRVEDSLYRMCHGYGFVRADVFVLMTNLQATVETKDGEIITQIRHVWRSDTNYDRLDYLNDLSRYVVAHRPGAEELHHRYEQVMNRAPQPLWQRYVGGVMGGAGFGVFFGCGVMDTVVAVIASILVVWLGERIAKYEENPFVYNFVISFIVEIGIILAVRMGFGQYSGRITVGVVMLLISGLGTTNGIRDLLHKDIVSGFMNILDSILGAGAIAMGIALAILLLRGVMI